jgi:hypothetical protein
VPEGSETGSTASDVLFARAIAEAWIAVRVPSQFEPQLADGARETDLGWVFVWDSRRRLEERDPRYSILGASPLLVTPAGQIIQLRTGCSINEAIEELRGARWTWGAEHPLRANLLASHAGIVQALRHALRHAPNENRLLVLGAVQGQLRAAYRATIPVVPIARCPHTGEVARHSLDTYGLDGLWWHADDACRPSETPPPTFFALTGALRLAGEPEYTAFPVRPGPGVPYVLPRLLELEGMRAVVSSVPVGRHTGYPVVYFADPAPEGVHPPTTWGLAAETDVHEEHDFDLAPWIERGKLLWIAPGDDELALHDDLAGCPFLDLEGTRQSQLISEGRVSVAS